MKYIIIFIAALFLQGSLLAQTPQTVNYQGVVRNASGEPVKDKDIKLRLSILSSVQQLLYSETHTIKTNSLGLFATKLGKGTLVSGNFSSIPWETGEKLLKVEVDVDGGNSFSLLGQPEMIVSVPYALQAESASEVVLNGDVTGINNANKVTALNGNPVSGIFPSPGDVLKWNGSQWQPGTDATSGGGSYNAGQGISISGNTISNTGDLSDINELQQLSLNNNTLSLSNNGGSVTLPSGGGSYTAGNGISITGNQISNTGDVSNTNEIQQLSLAGNDLTLSNGGGTITLPGSGGNNYWASAGGVDIKNTNIGTVFLGDQSTPYQTLWASSNNNSETMVAQQQGNGIALRVQSTNGNALDVSSDNGRAAYFRGSPNSSATVIIENPNLTSTALWLKGELGIQGPGGTIGSLSFSDGSFKIFGGDFGPSQDNARKLGSPALRWQTVYAANGTINTSDRREKQEITPINYGLDQVMKLQPVSYKWKSSPEQGRKLGFIAQDLQQVIPEVVADKEWNMDKDGKMSSKEAKVLGVYYSDIIPVVTKAIQEQQVMIEVQRQMIEELRKEMELLKKELQKRTE